VFNKRQNENRSGPIFYTQVQAQLTCRNHAMGGFWTIKIELFCPGKRKHKFGKCANLNKKICPNLEQKIIFLVRNLNKLCHISG